MARQKLGQHFLADQSVLKRISAAACGPTVVEIGPGKGALTEHLLRCSARVVAVELDPAMVAHLRGRFPALEIVPGDALKVDFTQWGPVVLAGNLPYYVASPIISKALRTGFPSVFLIQKEVAERITAKPGTRDYGYFSVEAQLFAQAELLFTVKPGAFRPPPKVDSAVVRLTPRALPPGLDAEAFLRFASQCFRQKRKTLRNNLAGSYSHIDELPQAGLRAEQLPLEEILGLFVVLEKLKLGQ